VPTAPTRRKTSAAASPPIPETTRLFASRPPRVSGWRAPKYWLASSIDPERSSDARAGSRRRTVTSPLPAGPSERAVRIE